MRSRLEPATARARPAHDWPEKRAGLGRAQAVMLYGAGFAHMPPRRCAMPFLTCDGVEPGLSYGLFPAQGLGTFLLIGHPWWRWRFWAGFLWRSPAMRWPSAMADYRRGAGQ